MNTNKNSKKQVGNRDGSDRADGSEKGTLRNEKWVQAEPIAYPDLTDEILSGQLTSDPGEEYVVKPPERKE